MFLMLHFDEENPIKCESENNFRIRIHILLHYLPYLVEKNAY